VPTNHSFRRDDDEGLLPTRPDSPSNYPEEFIEEAEDRPWTAPLQHSELLPEREILQEEMPTTAKRANKGSEPEKKQIEHSPELYQINDRKYCRMLLILQPARILANHNGLRSDPFGASTVVLSFGERQGGTESKADIFARNYFGSMTLSPRI
jgi:hypothetical protein